MPEHVRLDLTTVFDNPEFATLPRIGVVTRIRLEGDSLRARVGISDSGLHDDLAKRVGPASSKVIPLPQEMCSINGTVLGSYDPSGKQQNSLYLIAGQIDSRGHRPDAVMDYEQTDRCLAKASLAIGWLLRETPESLERIENPHDLFFGSKLLERAERSFGNRIFS